MNNRTSQDTLAKYFVGERVLDDLLDQYQTDYDRHFSMLNNLASSLIERKPILYIRNLPMVEPTAGTSSSTNLAAKERYRQIDEQLNELSETDGDQPAVEAGAISTAKAVVRQLSSRELAPPELGRLSDEAIVMLWGLGDTKYALTITDGELGYVVRRAKETIRRKSNIKLAEFSLLRIK